MAVPAIPRFASRLHVAVTLLVLGGALGCSSPGKLPARPPVPKGKAPGSLPSRKQPSDASPSLAETLVASLEQGSLRRVWVSPVFTGSITSSSGCLFSPDGLGLALSVLSFPGQDPSRAGQRRIMVICKEGEVTTLSSGPDDADPDCNPRSPEVAYLDS